MRESRELVPGSTFRRDFVLVYIISPNKAKFVRMKIRGPMHYSSCKELPKNVIFINQFFFIKKLEAVVENDFLRSFCVDLYQRHF